MGSHVLPPSFEINTERDPREIGFNNQGDVYLADNRMTRFRNFHPYIISDICPACDHRRILITDGTRKYIDSLEGHRVRVGEN